MDGKGTQYQGYFLVAGLGALGGGLIFAAVTRVIPKMMAKMMTGMMENMMDQMGEGDCDPADI